MKKTFTLTVESVAGVCEALLKGDFSKPHTLTVKPWKKDRTAAQNRLYWGVWLDEISKFTGHTDEELHFDYKREYLVPIFRRDDSEYRKMIETVMKLRGQKGYAWVVKGIINLTSTTDCDTKQFTEYLNAIEVAANGIGCQLPHPEDIYYEAMGKKSSE